MNNKHIPPAVGEFAVGERDQLLARIAEQAREIERLRLNIADYNEHERCYQAEIAALKAQPDPWKASGADWCRSIHSNPDAMAWTDFFVAVFPGQADKHELMFGWFANAMMAMHDHLKAQPSGVVRHVEWHADESVVHDGRVPNEVSQEVAAVLIEARRLNQPASAGDERGHDTKGSRKALGAMNAKLRAKVCRLERELAALSANHSEQVRHMVMEGVTVERDVFGTIHIKSGDFDFIQIRYQYPYTDNSGTWKLAERIVALLAAPSAGSQEQG